MKSLLIKINSVSATVQYVGNGDRVMGWNDLKITNKADNNRLFVS